MLDFEAIGNNIRNLRNARGYSQDTLAELLGVTHQAISRWECGLAAPTVDNLAELSALFDIPFEQLLCMGKPIDVTAADIFDGHSRMFVVKSVVDGKVKLNVADKLDVFMPQERLMLLKAVKEGKLKVDLYELRQKLTPDENRFLLGNQRKRRKK